MGDIEDSIKEKMLKYQEKYFCDFRNEEKPGFVSEDLEYYGIVYDPDYVCEGEFEPDNNRFIFRTRAKDTILHEMIHFYFEYLPLSEQEYVMTMLIYKIRKKISNFPMLAEEWFKFRQGFNYGLAEDKHDFAFFVVSLYLDIRVKYAPGTVYGYGLAEEWKEKGIRFDWIE